MVKGLSKKVIIVKSPEPKIFEQAIFIVRDDYLLSQGVSQKELMRQAKRAARGYVNQTDRSCRMSPLLFSVIGAVLTSMVWAIFCFLL